MSVAVPAIPAQRVTSLATAAAAGVGAGIISNQVTRPSITWVTLLGGVAVGTIGSLTTRGYAADALEGLASGCAGAFGFLVPTVIMAPTAVRQAEGVVAGVQRSALGAGVSQQLSRHLGWRPEFVR